MSPLRSPRKPKTNGLPQNVQATDDYHDVPSTSQAAAVSEEDSTSLLTDQDYYVYEDPPGSSSAVPSVHISPKRDGSILVPTFRPKKCVPYYCIEGTENFDDQVYEKRHQKWEQEEKRRKRWDLQQMREREYIQKQESRRKKSSYERRKVVTSLRPPPDSLHTIEVADKVPVSVFGCPLPKVEKSEFRLPWFDSKTVEQNGVKKKPGRKRAK